jgi:PIN domain nuclease of toxin-antitoxin system
VLSALSFFEIGIKWRSILNPKLQYYVDEYLQQRQQQAEEIRIVNEQKFDPQGLRDRLLAR